MIPENNLNKPLNPEPPLPTITPVPIPSKRVSLLGIAFVVLFLFVLIGGGVASAALIAYDKVVLPNTAIQSAIRTAVLSIPFAPKTANYVLEKSAIAASTLTSSSIDASIALSSSSLFSFTGSNNLDIVVKGSFDKTDSSNPKSQISVTAGTLLAAELRTLDKKVYIKINTFPTKLITSFIPVSEEMLNTELSHWIVTESNSLDTEARSLVEQNTQATKKTTTEALTEVLNNKTIMSKIALSTETLDGTSVYKLHPTVDAEFVNAYVAAVGSESDKQKLDAGKWLDSLKDFNLDIYVDKSSYHVAKINLSFSSKENSSLLSPVMEMVPGVTTNDFQVAAVLKFSDYNKPISVEAPTDTRTWQDVVSVLTMSLMQSQSEIIINPQNQFAQARDAQRRADLIGITNAIYQYAADNNGNLPVTANAAFPTKQVCIGISPDCFDLGRAGNANVTIVPTYINLIPKDPENGTDNNTQYLIYMTENGRLHAEAPSEKDPKTPIVVIR